MVRSWGWPWTQREPCGCGSERRCSTTKTEYSKMLRCRPKRRIRASQRCALAQTGTLFLPVVETALCDTAKVSLNRSLPAHQDWSFQWQWDRMAECGWVRNHRALRILKKDDLLGLRKGSRIERLILYSLLPTASCG